MINVCSISVIGNPTLLHEESVMSKNFTNGFVMSRDQQTLFSYAMLMRQKHDESRRMQRGRNKNPVFHNGVYAKANLDSSGNTWEASFMWDGNNWLYFDNNKLCKVDTI